MLGTQLAALALAATALAASGCGGSSKDQSTSAATAAGATTSANTAPLPATTVKAANGKALTHSQLIAMGDAICTRRNTKMLAISIGSEADFKRLMPQVASYDTTEANELSQLVPPASLKHRWQQILSDFHRYGEEITRVAQYASAGKIVSGMPYFRDAENLHGRVDVLAKQVGFKQCSKRRLRGPLGG